MEHRPFQVDPGLSRVSQDKIAYLHGKLGANTSALDGMIEACEAMFASAGLPPLKRDGYTGNSFDSHRLLQFATTLPEPLETQAHLFHALCNQYFHHGRSLSEHDVLLAAAAEAGIDVDAAHAVLVSDTHATEVRNQMAAAQADRVQSVPHFRIGDRPGFSGSDSDFGAIFAEIAQVDGMRMASTQGQARARVM